MKVISDAAINYAQADPWKAFKESVPIVYRNPDIVTFGDHL